MQKEPSKTKLTPEESSATKLRNSIRETAEMFREGLIRGLQKEQEEEAAAEEMKKEQKT